METSQQEVLWVIAFIVSAALVAMWTVLYLGMRSARDACCPARARRELHERLQAAGASAEPALSSAPEAAAIVGTPTLGRQRTARQKAHH